MWLLVARPPRPDAPYWAGRRWLAAVDAVLWPLAWVVVLRALPGPVGLMGPVLLAVVALCAAGRLHRAVWMNHRYWFTTWRWARPVLWLGVLGVLLKLLLYAGLP